MMFKPKFSLQNILKMKMMMFLITCFITAVLADDENADRDALTNDMLEHQLLIELGCIPPKSWKMIRDGSRNGFIKDVCLPQSYQVYEPPNLDSPTIISLLFRNKKILDIDERKRIITMNIEMSSFWQDPRIKTRPSSRRKLPSISKSFFDSIWTPISYPAIKDVKEINLLNDPIISTLNLITGKDANIIISRAVFPPNASVARTDYLPCNVIVITSFFSLIVPLSAIPGRIALMSRAM